MEAISPEDLVNYHLLELNSVLSNKLEGDCVFINSVIFSPLEKEFRIVLENLRNSDAKAEQTDHLIVLLQTTGGMMETVERLVAIMRQHYKCVSFVIPDYAYSAGTVLALSGDNIFMDYYSVLGPIDP